MSYTTNTFIQIIVDYTVKDCTSKKLLPSLTLAQAILESNCGNSGLTCRANNLFGIKGKYYGSYSLEDTKEYYNNKYITVKAKFRKYPSWFHSISDHNDMFVRMSRYHNLIGCEDYKKACKLVREDGYATDPNYTKKLISIIEKYKLNQYDSRSIEDKKEYVLVTIPNLRLRATPKGKILGYVKQGKLLFDSHVDGWYHIIGDQTGWISDRYASKVID